MSFGIKERVAGVSALIVVSSDPNRGIATIQEQRTKRATNKLAGQRTHPMETVEIIGAFNRRGRYLLKRERHEEAYDRLEKQEAHLANFDLMSAPRKFLGVVELAPQTVLYNRVFLAPPNVSVILGSESAEVGRLRWTPLEELLDQKRFDLPILRPGVYESATELWRFLKDPSTFYPRAYGFDQIRDRIPTEMFDLVESGFNVRAAASRLGLSMPPDLELAA